MNVDQLANVPGTLNIEGVNAAGQSIKLQIPICKSLPAAVDLAHNRDLINLGKTLLTPHELMRPQLESIFKKGRIALQAGDKDTAEFYQASWNKLHERMHDTIMNQQADELAVESYWLAGRKSLEGLRNEIALRAKEAGHAINMAELSSVVTVANASLVFASLQIATGEIADPTAATSPPA